MSIFLPLETVKTLGTEFQKRMEKELTISKMSETEKIRKKCFYAGPHSHITIWTHHPSFSVVALPYSWARHHLPSSVFSSVRRQRTQVTDISLRVRFRGTLRPEQESIKKETVQLLQSQKGCACIAVYPGGGKTITSLSLAQKIGLRCLILSHRIVLMDQWKKSIEGFLEMVNKEEASEKNNKGSLEEEELRTLVHVVTPKDETLPKDACFYVINAMNVPKFSIEEWESLRIGTVLVDECHVMVTQVMAQALSFISPRYLVGLSATPYRSDGLDIVLSHTFGPDKVTRSLFCKHHVLYHPTQMAAPDLMDEKGKRLWNPVLHFQATHEPRNDVLVDFILHPSFQHRNILVLCKRTDHIRTLEEKLRGRNETSITTFYGTKTSFDVSQRILLATFQKVGVGFSHDRLDMLVLACDCEEYFLQYLGRVFRRPDVEPIILDLVDTHPVLKRHFQTRKKVYTASGGQIQVVKELNDVKTQRMQEDG